MRLFGKNPVFERLRIQPQTIRKIYMQENFDEASYIYSKAKKWGIGVHVVPRSKMLKLAQDVNAQGIMGDVDDYKYSNYTDLLEESIEKHITLAFIDNITDPQNLGGIIRSLACLGGFGIVLPTHDSVSVNETVLRVASGGENHLKIAHIGNINNAIRQAKGEDFTIAGSVVSGGQSIYEVEFPRRLGIVIGSEQKGIREIIKKHLDLMVTVPMSIHTMSMNVSAAATVFAYEIKKQKEKR
jgi:23S rRNA (guanosine2251-2'-O)-methyltransferase